MNHRYRLTLKKARIYHLLIIQIIITLLVSLWFAMTQNKQAAFSALCGGFINSFTYWLFAKICLRHAGASQANKILKSFFLGEFIKITLTVIFITFAAHSRFLNLLSFLVAYLSSQMVLLFAPLVINSSGSQRP